MEVTLTVDGDGGTEQVAGRMRMSSGLCGDLGSEKGMMGNMRAA